MCKILLVSNTMNEWKNTLNALKQKGKKSEWQRTHGRFLEALFDHIYHYLLDKVQRLLAV